MNEEDTMDEKEFCKALERTKEILESPEYNECPCTYKNCPIRGKCFECVKVHRVKKHHVPECFQDMFAPHIEALARLIERSVEDDRLKIKGVVYEKIKKGEVESFYKYGKAK